VTRPRLDVWSICVLVPLPSDVLGSRSLAALSGERAVPERPTWGTFNRHRDRTLAWAGIGLETEIASQVRGECPPEETQRPPLLHARGQEFGSLR